MLPNAAFVLLASGVAGCIWEMVRPGRVVPGVMGVGMSIAGAYWLWRNQPSLLGIVCVVSGLVLLGGAVSKPYLAAASASAIALSVGVILLFPAPQRIQPALAISVSVIFSFAVAKLIQTAWLGYLHKREQ